MEIEKNIDDFDSMDEKNEYDLKDKFIDDSEINKQKNNKKIKMELEENNEDEKIVHEVEDNLRNANVKYNVFIFSY